MFMTNKTTSPKIDGYENREDNHNWEQKDKMQGNSNMKDISIDPENTERNMETEGFIFIPNESEDNRKNQF